jgi:hypothetical protein
VFVLLGGLSIAALIGSWSSQAPELKSDSSKALQPLATTEDAASTGVAVEPAPSAVRRVSLRENALMISRNSGDRGAGVDIRSTAGAPAVRAESRDPLSAAELQSRWSAEPRDLVWSRAVEEATVARLNKLGLDPGLILGVDCRQSSCRLEFDVSDLNALQKLQQSAKQDGVRGAHVMVSLDSKQPAFAFYLSRPPQSPADAP